MSESALFWLDKASRARVTVIGEPIMDKYTYVMPLGKSTKDNIVTFAPLGTEMWRGGGWIVTENVRTFVSAVGYRDADVRPVLKTRYVEKSFTTKLFSLLEDAVVSERVNKPLIEGSDIILVADYGHGLLRDAAIQELTSRATFIALTVQSNSANWGFNLLTKWHRADYVVVDQNELRLACHDQYGTIDKLARQQHERLGTHVFVVTMGHEGCLVLNGQHERRFEAVADKVVDRMGAGDAFLAATAPLAWIGAPIDVIGTVGNIAGAIKVGKIGNQPVTRKEVEAWLKKA